MTTDDLVFKDGKFHLTCPVCNGEMCSESQSALVMFMVKHFKASHPTVAVPQKLGGFDVTFVGQGK